MSPEPTQETSKDLDLGALNEHVRLPAVSDSEDDDPYDTGHAGYTLLSDNPNGIEVAIDEDNDEDDEWTLPPEQQNDTTPESMQPEVPSEVLEVWSSTNNQSNIDLDSEKICQVKSLMASFTLPSSVIPEWASEISEDQWKDQLIQRINEIQKKKTN